ncbi:MAG: hypothetical protein ACR2NU_01385, partial [Aeoliella sp.]
GPTYNRDQDAALEAAEKAGLSYPYTILIDMNFHAKSPDKPLKLDEEEINRRITAQVMKVVNRKSICWWYLRPEELRFWHENEMEYLQAATEAVREADPMKRPIWMYEPNHRNVTSLVKTGAYQDIIGKGCYTNLTGHQNQRVWVRWSMEQQTQAIAILEDKDGRKRIPLVMPELCCDPEDPALDHLIPRWVRHDVYLGLMSGGKGVAIWSLYPRNEVKRTWQIWYDAYAHVATELTGPRRLGQVFLFGNETTKLTISILDGPKEVALDRGPKNKLEAGTTNEDERKTRTTVYPSLSVRELEYRGALYLFLCNSSGTAAVRFQSNPLPKEARITEIFASRNNPHAGGTLHGWIGPLEVQCYKIVGSMQ